MLWAGKIKVLREISCIKINYWSINWSHAENASFVPETLTRRAPGAWAWCAAAGIPRTHSTCCSARHCRRTSSQFLRPFSWTVFCALEVRREYRPWSLLFFSKLNLKIPRAGQFWSTNLLCFALAGEAAETADRMFDTAFYITNSIESCILLCVKIGTIMRSLRRRLVISRSPASHSPFGSWLQLHRGLENIIWKTYLLVPKINDWSSGGTSCKTTEARLRLWYRLLSSENSF